MACSIPLPAGLPVDASSWEQTRLVIQQVVVHFLAIIQQQAEQIRTLEGRMAALEARLQQRSSNSDRPLSSDRPYEKRTTRSYVQGRPGAKPGHPGHRQALLAPTEVVEVMPAPCVCGQQEFPEMMPYYTQQVIELPAIQMEVTHVGLYEARCPQCGRLLKAPKAAIEALVGRWAGLLVSDGYAVYQQWVHGRQTCLAHLIRRARGLAERKDPEVA